MYPKNRISILLIEDNPADANLIRLYLGESSQKIDVFQCETFFEGMETIRKKDIDIVLLSLELPDCSGFRTLTRYMENAAQLPVVVLTGINNEIIGNQSVKAGAQDYLVKGQFDARTLSRAIRYAIQRFAALRKTQEITNKLSVSEKRHEEAQKMALFGTWEMDLVSNEMHWSDEIFRIFGLPQGSIAPAMSDYIAYAHPEDRNAVHDFFDRVVKEGTQQQLEHRIITNGHTLKHISLNAKVLYEELTEKLLIVGVLQDVSQRIATECNHNGKNASGKSMVLREDNIRDLGFGLRKPLASLFNNLQQLGNTMINTQQKAFLSELLGTTEELSQMIHKLLNISATGPAENRDSETEFKIKDLVYEVQTILQIGAAHKQQIINVLIPDDMPGNLIGDPLKISLLLYNLATYSGFRSEKKGQLTITVRVREKELKPYLYLSVEDEGPGMTPAQKRHLLDTEKNGDIAILGQGEADSGRMAIASASRIANSLGGKLEIISKADTGIIFRVEFPVKVTKQLSGAADGTPGQPLRILLVEDHFLNRIATKKVLTSWSDFVTVDFAENGLAGVEKVKRGKYDIVLMDIQMPVMDGIAATQAIRNFSTVPIIALSSNSSKQESERCMSAGCDDYLSKPFKAQELYVRITNARMKGKSGVAAVKVK